MTLSDLNGQKIALKAVNGQYVCAEGAGAKSLIANRTKLGSWEQFTVDYLGDNRFALKAVNGKYVCAENAGKGALIANRTQVGTWETFEWIESGTKVSIRARANNQLVCAEDAGKKNLIANRGKIGSWERFEVINVSQPAVSGYQKHSWMGDLAGTLGSKTLAELTLPGTHDSGTNDLQLEIAPDASGAIPPLMEYGQADGATHIGDYIRDMAQAQSLPIKTQLDQGIRYIDLRVCYQHNDWYTCHSLLGSHIPPILQDVKTFLTGNTQEIVVFKVGFKGTLDETKAKQMFEKELGALYQWSDAKSLLGTTLSSLVQSGKRAIFISDGGNFTSSYDESAITNSGTVESLKKTTNGFTPGSTFLESQVFRPIGNPKEYVLGYVQANGCRLMAALPALLAVSVVGPVLTSVGALALPGFVLYLKNCAPEATSLKVNAANSRTIIKDYCNWVKSSNKQKPNMMICDYFQEVPLVDIAIAMCIDKPYAHLTQGLSDVSMQSTQDPFTQLFECGADGIATAFQLAGYGASEAGQFLKDNIPGMTGEILGSALQGAGYALDEVGDFLEDAFGLAGDALSTVLEGAGYAVHEVEGFVSDVAGGVADVAEDVWEGTKNFFSGW
ncbi:MAG: hypothetical protein AAFQ98_05980 [Bacteroidota bacterium]